MSKSLDYILISAASNEEKNIPFTLASICAQTILPKLWIIVVNNSNDRTREIIKEFRQKAKFIEILEGQKNESRSFSAQCIALRQACDRVKNISSDFIGNVDADVSFTPNHFEKLIDFMAKKPDVGMSGGSIFEVSKNGLWSSRKSNRVWSVPHATQFFRREVFEKIGGYQILKYGGPDSLATIQVKMLGKSVIALTSLRVFHHRPSGGAESLIRTAIRLGRMDYSLGNDLLYEIGKCLFRICNRDFSLVALFTLCSYLISFVTCRNSDVPIECRNYVRAEHRMRILELLKSFFRGGSFKTTNILKYLGKKAYKLNSK